MYRCKLVTSVSMRTFFMRHNLTHEEWCLVGFSYIGHFRRSMTTGVYKHMFVSGLRKRTKCGLVVFSITKGPVNLFFNCCPAPVTSVRKVDVIVWAHLQRVDVLICAIYHALLSFYGIVSHFCTNYTHFFCMSSYVSTCISWY